MAERGAVPMVQWSQQVVSNGEVWNGRLSTTGTFVSGLMIPPQSEQMRKKYQTDTSMFMGPTCLIPSGIDPAMPKTTWLQDARRQTVWTGSTVAVQDVDEMQKEFFALAALKQRIADLQGLIAEKEFRIVDADGDGKLSKKELANAMPSASATEVEARFKAMDTDGDGSISLAEYAAKANVKQVFRGWSEPKLSQPPGSHRVSAEEYRPVAAISTTGPY